MMSLCGESLTRCRTFSGFDDGQELFIGDRVIAFRRVQCFGEIVHRVEFLALIPLS
jgi:hypothetical protein